MLNCIILKCGDDECYSLDAIRYDAAGGIIYDVHLVGRIQPRHLRRQNRETHDDDPEARMDEVFRTRPAA